MPLHHVPGVRDWSNELQVNDLDISISGDGLSHVLYRHGPGLVVRELVLRPRQEIPCQRHQLCSALWFVSQGQALLEIQNDAAVRLGPGEHVSIPAGQWYHWYNTGPDDLRILEIQWGDHCCDDDVERAK